MNRKFIRSATSGFAVLGAALSLNMLNAVSPVELLNLTRLGQTNSSSAQAQTLDQEEAINVRVYQQASPAVVSIESNDGTGSGIIISQDGLVITNAHVVSGSEKVKVTLADGREFEAEVVAFGENGLDLAAVKISGQANLPTVQIASSNSLTVGQRAFAIGNPFGQFQGTFTTGIVSRVDTNRGLIQTDTAINPGNSGGPLLNSQGQLIGVNSAIFSPGSNGANNTGIGFAISTDRVEPFLTAVRNGTAPRIAQQSPLLGGGYIAKRIAMNTPVTGRLDDNSNILPTDRSFFDAYTFEGRQGDRITIEMSSTQVDPFIILLAPDGQNVAQDDDSGGGSNARLTAALPTNGIYTVLANTYQAGETGEYSIRLAPGSASAPQRQAQNQPEQNQPEQNQPEQNQPEQNQPEQNDRQRPSPGQTILREEGTLGPGSQVLPDDGSLYQEYSFEGRQGQSITASMESPDFDTYLIVIGPGDRVIAQNDDAAPQNTNSTVTVTLPEDGTYRVIANAYDRTGRGRYTVEVR